MKVRSTATDAHGYVNESRFDVDAVAEFATPASCVDGELFPTHDEVVEMTTRSEHEDSTL